MVCRHQRKLFFRVRLSPGHPGTYLPWNQDYIVQLRANQRVKLNNESSIWQSDSIVTQTHYTMSSCCGRTVGTTLLSSSIRVDTHAGLLGAPDHIMLIGPIQSPAWLWCSHSKNWHVGSLSIELYDPDFAVERWRGDLGIVWPSKTTFLDAYIP